MPTPQHGQSRQLTESIIGAAIEVHRTVGPGLIESIYEECMCVELGLRGMEFARQRTLPLEYKGRQIGGVLEIDLVVEEQVLVELKSVESLLAVHSAQLLTYLRLTNLRYGLLINFNVARLSSGVKRVINGFGA